MNLNDVSENLEKPINCPQESSFSDIMLNRYKSHITNIPKIDKNDIMNDSSIMTGLYVDED